MPKSSTKLIAILSKSKFETLGSTYLAPKIRFCEVYCERYLPSFKMVQKSSYKLIAIISQSKFET